MADSKFCAGCQRSDEDITAVSWCSDCSELVCKACSRVHKRMSPPHKVIPTQEIQQLSSSLLTLSKNCDNHPDQKIALYCCQHDKAVCKSCVPVSHQNCKSVISIEKAARGVKDGTAISDLERRISNLCQVTESRRSQSEKTLVDLDESRTKIKTRVSEIKRKVIAHLDTLEAEIHKDIDSKYTNCTESVSRNRNIIQSSADSLSTWKSDINSLKQHTSEVHLFQVVKFLDAKTYQKELEIREIQTATVPILKYHPSESESKIKKLVRAWDGDVYCTDFDNNKLFLVSSDGTEREIYISPGLEEVGDVAVDDCGDVYLRGCSPDNIHKISNDEQKHDIVLTADDGINGPFCISYNNETKELLVLNEYGRSINIYKKT
ncbi:Hypothetical predicted protein [Mytilus galloprovincialis]|uniref:B box-type domain-containing protein n=1 Tax=Mytilus galloprovincialis TaxID=29158 RepID=A0A8B6EBV1_MYTGA|nr:Hypothetical predicted protein [Mytilus galloprovincialis]